MSKSPKSPPKGKKDPKKEGKQEDSSNEVDTVVKCYPAKYFIWEKVHTKFTKTGLLKLRSKKGLKKWGDRYVGLYLNYLVCFKAGKSKSGEPADKQEEAKEVIALEKITEARMEQLIVEKVEGYCFRIPVQGEETYVFNCETEEIGYQWMKAIKSYLEQISKVEKRQSGEQTAQRLKEAQLVFAEQTFRIPLAVNPDDADKYIAEMKKYKEEYKKYGPYIHSLALFAEFQVGRNKGYIEWFTNKSRGVSASLNSSEEEVLKNWADKIKKCPKDCLDATETMFYREDLETITKEANKMLKLIDIYNNFEVELKRRVETDPPKFIEEREQIQAWVTRLESYPNSQDIDMTGFSNGLVAAEAEEWQYVAAEFAVKRTKYRGLQEDLSFTCKDHHCQFVHPLYGIILWNNKSWIWTHPRCPFIIRYDFFPNKGVFKQHTPQPDSKMKQSPALTDWQIATGEFRAVTVGNRDPAPQPPEITSYVIRGNMPPPVMLIVASFPVIRSTVRKILGMGE